MNNYKKILLLFTIAVAVEGFCLFIKSGYLCEFLQEKAVEIQITLLAINTATASFIVSKLNEISIARNINFKVVYKEIRLSMYEQIILIGVSFFILTIEGGEFYKELVKENERIKYCSDVILIFSFLFSLEILRDTGVSMFDIMINNQDDTDKN